MEIHGWKSNKSDKQRATAKPPREEEIRIAHGKSITSTVGYLAYFSGAEFLSKFDEYVTELRTELADKFQGAKN